MTRLLDFTDVGLYAVTPEPADTPEFLSKVKGALEGGVDALQLRWKNLRDRDVVAVGRKVKALCAEAGALFLIDNRVDIALFLDADGIHVGHEDLPIDFIRSQIGHRKIVGRSAHSLPEAIEVQRAGADYCSCGPLWATPTRPDYKAVGLNLIGLYNAAIHIPYVAIGGIDRTNIGQVVEAGAKTVAIVRAIFDETDTTAAARFFKEQISRNRTKENIHV